MSSNISANDDIIFQEYPTVLNKNIIEKIVLNTMKTKQLQQPQKEKFATDLSFNKTGYGININTASIVMAVLIPLFYLILIIYKKTITIQFYNINISGIFFFIFNLIIFIITLKTINKIKNGYNCKVNEDLQNKIIIPTLQISALQSLLTDKTIINILGLNFKTSSIICSNNLNNDNINNIKSASFYYGFMIFAIILQIVQIIFLSYYSLHSAELKEKNNKMFFLAFYVLLSINLCAIFICLIVNIIANKIAYISDVPIISFKQLLNENSKLLPSQKLTPDQINELQGALKNIGVNDNYLICNSNGILNEFKYKDLNNSFSGFLLVVLIITLIMFFFLTNTLFNFKSDGFEKMIQWIILSFSIGLVAGFISFISALDMQNKNSEIIGVCVGFASAGIPILLKIILSIINKT